MTELDRFLAARDFLLAHRTDLNALRGLRLADA